MNSVIKEHIVSAVITFVSTFLTVLGATVTTIHDPQWTWAFWGAILLSAVRAAGKEVWAKAMPVKLGGRS